MEVGGAQTTPGSRRQDITKAFTDTNWDGIWVEENASAREMYQVLINMGEIK